MCGQVVHDHCCFTERPFVWTSTYACMDGQEKNTETGQATTVQTAGKELMCFKAACLATTFTSKEKFLRTIAED